MSSAAERQARADQREAEYANAQPSEMRPLERVEQACEDAMADIRLAPVLRIRSAIREMALPDNPIPIMRSQADTWLKATDGLVREATKVLATKAARDAAPLPPPQTPPEA